MLQSFSSITEPTYPHVDMRHFKGACPHCSSEQQAVFHGGHCPRVKAIEYNSDGSIRRIEFHAAPGV